MVRKRNLLLNCQLCPGDLCTLTAAIESLHAQYPGRFLTGVRTSCDELFLRNPHISHFDRDCAEFVDMHYGDIQLSDRQPHMFIRGFTRHLERYLGMPLPPLTNRPHLYLSHDEKEFPQKLLGSVRSYWVVTAGVKDDFTLKQWPVEYYQQVVDHFRGRIEFVQVGANEHDHPELDGVRSLVGLTGHRDLMRVVCHAKAGLGPITYLQHLCAAFEKPYVALLGGREPVSWTQYPLQRTLHTLGALPCCRLAACWRSRVVPLQDDKEQDQSLCELPIRTFSRPVGKCMSMIKPEQVIGVIEGFCEGGVCSE